MLEKWYACAKHREQSMVNESSQNESSLKENEQNKSTLAVSDVTVEYSGGKLAVNNVSFNLNSGENTALIGANGAGKTSLMLALVGVLPVKTGEIRIVDSVVDSVKGVTVLSKQTLRDVRARVGLVFQNPDDQLFMPSIFEDIAFGPRSFGCSEDETNVRVNEVLDQLGISHLRDSSPLKLSGGEKRLCAIAAVLATKPEVLLFDEPTAFLDPRARRNLAALFENLPQGKLIATHDLAFAEATCTRVLLLQEGRLIADGGQELFTDTQTLEAAGL